MVEPPKTQYARSDDGTFIAYQVFGRGPDVLVAWPWISHLERFWEDPDVGAWLRALALYARVITMDQRGIGLSDRMTQMIDLETKVDDVRAVLEAAGSNRTILYGQGVDGGSICAMFAATYPERVAGLVFWTAAPTGTTKDDFPWYTTPEENRAFNRLIEETWGDEDAFDELLVEAGLPSVADDRVARARWAKTMRNAASRGDAVVHERMFDDTDYRSILSSIHVPTAILQPDEAEGNEAAAWMASRIPDCTVIALPEQSDFPPYMGERESNLRAVRSFMMTVQDAEVDLDRVLATVMFTDIVGSSQRATELGDRRWSELLQQHHAAMRRLLARFRGVEVDTAGDGFFATFDGPARAVRCAEAAVRAMAPLGLSIRAGVHTGEVATIDGKAGGMAVLIGARVGALAGASEVLVSRTVKDLVAGSGLVLEDAGERQLKGIPDLWRLYRAVS